MNPVDQLLCDTADFLQGKLNADLQLRAEISALLDANQNPSLVRHLNGIGPLSGMYLRIDRQ